MRLHGAFDGISGRGIEHVMAVQLQGSYFPVSEAAMAATASTAPWRLAKPSTWAARACAARK